MITQNKETQDQMTPADAMQLLQEGNKRFVDGQRIDRTFGEQVKATTNGQFPFAAVVSCIDSRIPTEIVFDQGIGDIFNVRIAGNFMNPDILGSLEFACKVAGSKLIVILGHTSCGAVKGAVDQVELGNLTQMLDKISPSVRAIETAEGVDRSSKNIDFVNRVAENNVHRAIKELLANSEVLNEMYSNNEIDIKAAMYDVASGAVNLINPTAEA